MTYRDRASQRTETEGISDAIFCAQTCDRLDHELWDAYKRFDFPAVLGTAELLIAYEGATPKQQATGHLLSGSVACIEGRTSDAAEEFREAISADPSVVPEERIFPKSVCSLYTEVRGKTHKGAR